MLMFYAVAVGRVPGIYNTWEECNKVVHGFPGARFKKFNGKDAAEAFIKDNKETMIPVPSYTTIYNKRRKIATSEADVDHFVNTQITSDILVVYTDGACSDNGNVTLAKAGIGVWFGKDDKRNVSERLPGELQTNNRAEIYAAIRALEIINDPKVDIEIRSDSKNLINSMTVWYHKWESTNWKNGKILNRDLLERLLHMCKQRTGKIIWTHVAGHSGEYGNEEADKLATRGALK